MKYRSFIARLLIGLTISVGTAASADGNQHVSLSDGSYLRKLSLHIKGTIPTAAEYNQLRALPQGKSREHFFEAKIAEYLLSPLAANKLVVRVDERFKLTTSKSAPSSERESDGFFVPYSERNAFDSLVRELAIYNQSWDQLLIGKTYHLYPVYKGEIRMSDWGFMRALIPNILPGRREDRMPSKGPDGRAPTLTPVNYTFAEDDERIAGVLTTERFFDRYTTTEVNKNRRRAAAVFNVFLCDSMAASLPPPPSDPSGGLDKAFPKTSAITISEIQEIEKRATKTGDVHGNNKDCNQCHYKLDPMGAAFAASTFSLSPDPAPGSLVFRDPVTDTVVNRPGGGLGAIAKSLTQERAYRDCQVRTFWNWFIGEDRALNRNRLDQLGAQFDQVGRRTNDFISLLVKSDEFRNLDLRSTTQVRADEVKSVLKHCSDCHGGAAPNFTSWPIGGTTQTMRHWTDRMTVRLDLAHDGQNRTMPPDVPGSWQPTSDDLKMLKDWLTDGAPNEDGDKQI